MQTERRLVRMADGRDIDVLIAGPEGGRPLVIHEGTPVGLVLNARLGNAAIERGLRPVLAAPRLNDRAHPGARLDRSAGALFAENLTVARYALLVNTLISFKNAIMA